MLKLFGPLDKSYITNGDKIIKPIRAKIRKEDNGDFYLDLETDLSYVNDLIEGNIIVANTPQGDQAFRISNPNKTKTKIDLKARHVFYDSEDLLIADSYVVNKNCNDALDHLNRATDTTSPFTVISDVGTVNSFRCVRKSLYEAIQTVLERWGGHLVRDNFTVAVRTAIGQDNGVTVRYAKNLKDITSEEQWDDVVTKLLPVGKDGILLNDLNSSADLYVYSATQYQLPYTRTASFTQDDIVEADYRDSDGNLNEAAYRQALVNDLRVQAQAYVDAHCVPEVNYTLRANLERITDVGDTVEVIDERLGINIMTNVIAYDYDCILERYTELEFGNFKPTLSGLIGGITETTERIVDERAQNLSVTLGAELTEATNKIWSAMGDSYVIYDGDKILVVDSLPKETATNVILINNGGIAFSQTGINGTFNSAWTIDGTLNMQNINVINLVADLIRGGTLKLGSKLNEAGKLELYDESNNLIGEMTKDGLKMYGQDGSYVLMNNDVGFAGFDRTGAKIYWADAGEFHMAKAVVEDEISLCKKLRFIPISITEGGILVNDGIGLVSDLSAAEKTVTVTLRGISGSALADTSAAYTIDGTSHVIDTTASGDTPGEQGVTVNSSLTVSWVTGSEGEHNVIINGEAVAGIDGETTVTGNLYDLLRWGNNAVVITYGVYQ